MMAWATYSAVKDVVLFLVAIYAAILSTVNFRQAARKERRSIRVSASTAMPTYGPALGPPFARLEAVNDGHRTVTVSLLTWQLPDKSRLVQLHRGGVPGMPDTELPARLTEGEVAHVSISYADLGGALLGRGITTKIKLVPVCEDTVGGRYIGKEWDVDPHEFVRMTNV